MRVENVDCPWCQAKGSLRVSFALFARPLGSHSVAGTQMKVSAVEHPILTCTDCSLYLVGKLSVARHVVFGDDQAEGQ